LPPFVSIAYLHVTKYQTEVNLLKREKERAIISEQRVALFFFQIGRKARLVFFEIRELFENPTEDGGSAAFYIKRDMSPLSLFLFFFFSTAKLPSRHPDPHSATSRLLLNNKRRARYGESKILSLSSKNPAPRRQIRRREMKPRLSLPLSRAGLDSRGK